MPRKPRDIEADLKALQDKARELKARQKAQLGELVLATGADSLSAEELAGLLLTGLEQARSAPQTREGWCRRGETFFQRGGAANGAAAGNGARPPRHTAPPRHHPDGTQPPVPGTAAD
jgi:DNA-binding protein H-NS